MFQSYNIKRLSVATVLILTISNVILTIHLLNVQNCSYIDIIKDSVSLVPKIQHITQAPCIEYGFGVNPIVDNNQNNLQSLELSQSTTSYLNININVGRWDNQRLYKYFDFIIIGDKFVELSQQYVVCLATQSSIERLHSLVGVANHWNGPISIAVFVAGDDEYYIFLLYIHYLRHCFTSIRDNVSFHLSFPKLRQPKNQRNIKKKLNGYDCKNPEAALKSFLQLRTAATIKWRLNNVYPQNHMRNLGRKGCQNENVFLTDVDIIPSINFTEQLDKFLRNSKCTKLCAYVIPTYEIDVRVKFPTDKKDLIRLVHKGLARPFHEKVFIYNQFATNFSRWQKDLTSDIDTHISHNVTNFEFLYEPFYVTSDNAPIHDERFMGYGFTRNSQVYEMYVSGYVFQVLSPIFTCHWGLQQKKTRPAWREQQNNLNRKQFEQFKKEVWARYRKDPLRMFASKSKN